MAVPPSGPPAGTAGARASPREITDLQPGISWAEGIEPAAWRRAWRQAGAHLPSRLPDPYGLPELREEIAAYLRRSRGLAVRPEHVLVTQGVSSGLALLADALLTPGDKAGIEEPGYPTGREVLHRAGAQVVPCRVDAHGIVPEELPGDLRLLYTTPAHQYPLGGRLPVSRRQALIAWARATGAIIVEDDYDSEFRYDVGPLPALHSMDPDVIVYLGTASKVLATAFGAGWLVAPPALVDRLAALRPRLGVRIPEPVQHAMLALLRSGDLERHVRKMRLEYARRRAALVDGLTHARPGADGARHARVPFRLLGDTAGMHVVLELPGDYPAARLVDAAAERGVTVYPLDRYFAGPPTMSGLILGYGTATLPQLRRAAAELSGLLTPPPFRSPPPSGLGRPRDQAVISKAAMTLVGRSRTTSSPGTPLRLPNSSARSWPMYRAAIAVAVRTSSPGSSDSAASPWTWTKPYGGSSRSTQSVALGSRASARPLTVSFPVLKTREPSSTMNQTRTTSGLPSRRRRPACRSGYPR